MRKGVSQIDDPFKQVAEALNGHQVTDSDGQLLPAEQTAADETTAQETNTVEETAPAEKPAETEAKAPKAPAEETETELAEDETGKRYVPESRFKEVYGKQKALEREIEQLRRSQVSQPLQQPTQQPLQPQTQPQVVDKTTALELDLLKTTLSQFNPDHEDYDPDLDRLGALIYKANPGITMLEAGRRALAEAKALTKKQTQIVAEARQVKSLQSDQGITTRVKSSGQPQAPDPDKMSLDEKEEWLKSNGMW